MTLRTILAVAIGGVLGTAAATRPRHACCRIAHDAFPWSTLIVNVVGSLVLGFLVARVWPIAPDWLRAGLGAGVLGSFTTFSAVAVAMIELPLPTAALLPRGQRGARTRGGAARVAARAAGRRGIHRGHRSIW